ncbi:hypothetical protein [Alteromonas ponticola]|uniref:Uncharacterized protein n=1 Tax=Alteromonas ponticola TaxID=2720613 RepID=A0ABX1QWS1_9ALTE|nr:hypothetical protein [Alteromonas ponticola]NMH58695.1 hypothetical protein [Alteromonas ponticola]
MDEILNFVLNHVIALGVIAISSMLIGRLIVGKTLVIFGSSKTTVDVVSSLSVLAITFTVSMLYFKLTLWG